ncbi:MAG TPA: DoxX family protein [Chromatiales bacterium]|nr:DoxX family protein [Thiotrichales bacterium]HIP68760.1 DoxX family protein [Chromatiales bacterium]
MKYLKKVIALVDKISIWLAPVFDLVIRLYVAKAFFLSGLTKIKSWNSTVQLFEYEYTVPLLSPKLAAFLGTAAELSLPVLLALGLLSRPAALALFIFNYVAMTSYPDISPAGIKEHWLWGALLLVTFFHGPGKISLDHLLRNWAPGR